MIRKLQINNYKSLHDLTLEVGRFNVLIGENGCGKSNLLEAIALVAAAVADKLDNEFLASRGIRVTEPKLMRSAFSEEALQQPIAITVGFKNLDVLAKYTLINDNQPYSKWTNSKDGMTEMLVMTWETVLKHNKDFRELIEKDKDIEDLLKKVFFERILDGDKRRTKSTPAFLERNESDARDYIYHHGILENDENEIKNFIIYSPENTALRNFYKEGQIEPLGINGEGLFKLLRVIQNKSTEKRAKGITKWLSLGQSKSYEPLQEIRACLQLFHWFSELEIPTDLSPSEDKVSITDRYLTQIFDQRSANEGFLFVLFYIALMVSDDTPKIFAIDNIDTSLNPKLCTKLIKELVRLAKKYDKQVFVTTHNPAILDGIDLGDDEQRLLVLSRNKQGHTRYKRITLEDKPRSSTNEDLKLSEAFLRGYLGGLPKGF